jgi:predicted esterase
MQQSEAQVIHVETTIRGRSVMMVPGRERPRNFLLGFHGYAENAEDQIGRLNRLVPDEDWLLCSIQALHPFYTRSDGQVVASWMTRLDRELAIADNLRYVGRVVDAVTGRYGDPARLVLCGFSQGAAMAYRTAAALPTGSWVVAVGGDIPPELTTEAISRFRGVFVCRGERDRQYPQSRLEEDTRRLKESRVPYQVVVYPGGHQWNSEVDGAASLYLKGLVT